MLTQLKVTCKRLLSAASLSITAEQRTELRPIPSMTKLLLHFPLLQNRQYVCGGRR